MEVAKPRGQADDKLAFSRSAEAKCSVDRAWEVISDVDSEPRYYEGLGSVKTVSRKGNVIEREVVVGFLKHSGRQTVTLFPRESVEVRMTRGPMIGTRTTTLSPIDGSTTAIQVSWDVELRVPSLVQAMVKKEIVRGTEEALDKLVREAERAEDQGKAD